MIECRFLNPDETTAFVRSDMEEGHWVQEEQTVNAVFPYDKNKVIQRGQILVFQPDPSSSKYYAFEVRTVSAHIEDGYQQFTAESLAIADLQDVHIEPFSITGTDYEYAEDAFNAILNGTQWSAYVGITMAAVDYDINRGSVWQAVMEYAAACNLKVESYVYINANGELTGKTIRLVDSSIGSATIPEDEYSQRLSIKKNLLDPCVTYDDSEVLTALYGYGATVNVTRSGQDDSTEELTFSDVVWTANSSHPAKPSGQTYIEWPEKTAIYGRKGRPRFGYYQNVSITNANILLAKTWEVLKTTCEPKIRIDGTYADLRRLGLDEYAHLSVGDGVLVEIEETGEVFVKSVIRQDVNLVDPSENVVEIGDYIPNIIYINRDIANKTNGGSRVGGGGGARGQTLAEAELSETFTAFEKTDTRIGMVVGTRNGGYYVKAGEIALAINETGEPGSYESTAYITADHVNISGTSTAHALAGAMHVNEDGELIIDQAGGMFIERTESGVTAQFGVWDRGNLTGLTVAQLVNGETNATLNADHINISGTSTVRLMSDELEVDANGNLVVKASGGLYVRRTEAGTTVQLGVYDQGNLTGGVIVTKVNGETNAYITADHVNISATSNVQTLAGAMHVDAFGKLILDNAGGVYVSRTNQGVTAEFGVWDRGNLTGGVMVQQINGQTSIKISADTIDINGIVTALQSWNIKALQITGTVITGDVSVSSPLGSFTGLSCSVLTVASDAVSWKSKSVVTGFSLSRTAERWAYLDANGNIAGSLNTYMVHNVTKSTATINYLGKADS